MAGPWFDAIDPVLRRRTTIHADPETGLPLIIATQQDATAITEANKRASANFDAHDARGADMVRVASLPLVIVRHLEERGIWQDAKRLNQWLDDPENRHFR